MQFAEVVVDVAQVPQCDRLAPYVSELPEYLQGSLELLAGTPVIPGVPEDYSQVPEGARLRAAVSQPGMDPSRGCEVLPGFFHAAGVRRENAQVPQGAAFKVVETVGPAQFKGFLEKGPRTRNVTGGAEVEAEVDLSLCRPEGKVPLSRDPLHFPERGQLLIPPSCEKIGLRVPFKDLQSVFQLLRQPLEQLLPPVKDRGVLVVLRGVLLGGKPPFSRLDRFTGSLPVGGQSG